MSIPRYNDPDADWLDWVAVWRAVNGVPVGRPLTYSELIGAIRRMRCQNMSWDIIADRLGLPRRELLRVVDNASSRQRKRTQRARTVAAT